MNREELRRLQKAARDNNKNKLNEWASLLQEQIRVDVCKFYEEEYEKVVQTTVDNMLTAMVYTIIYSEELNLKETDIPEFIKDLQSSIDQFRTGVYTPDEYKDIMIENGYEPVVYKYSKLYEEHIDKMTKARQTYADKIKELQDKINQYESLIENTNKTTENRK